MDDPFYQNIADYERITFRVHKYSHRVMSYLMLKLVTKKQL